ncbi:DUF6683 family protein [Brevundimonas diminuta]|uniref:DUF6683 family protein n=1 Tax=Brevundimonas diminuta TaxID=293 RepID=UPI002D7FEA93|nr:DUF6683 family protein [Brevundimonas diminuta]
MKYLVIMAAMAYAATSAPMARAQDYVFQGFATADAMNQMHAAIRDNMMEPPSQARAPSRGAAAASATAPERRATVQTTYRSSSTVSTRVRAQFAEFIERTSGREAAERARSAFQGGDPIASWASIVRQDGLRTGDLADAMAAYWILNWIMANQGDNNRTQALAVRDQVRGVIGGSPAVARLGDAGRQEMAEVLMLNFLVQQATYVDAMQRGDQAMMRRLGDAAVARFRNEMGVDLRRLQLTDAGLVSAS